MTTAKRLSHTWETRFVQSESGCQDASTFSMNVVALSMAPAFYGAKFLVRQYFGFFAGRFYTGLKHSAKQLLMAECSGSRLKKPLDKPIEEYITD